MQRFQLKEPVQHGLFQVPGFFFVKTIVLLWGENNHQQWTFLNVFCVPWKNIHFHPTLKYQDAVWQWITPFIGVPSGPSYPFILGHLLVGYPTSIYNDRLGAPPCRRLARHTEEILHPSTLHWQKPQRKVSSGSVWYIGLGCRSLTETPWLR